ncbi:Ankyrin repeat-containing protein [Glarea lozoyensis ATCC 20868]|uniref:Ankyrin repeat-containing protein n=1 Tax=Glarea lozoyensis (strain ATCC 20868 / MF5171) TaxID=1116229 RepID=S3DDZ1_GLAL2|nr:Ankyrin repeat-containing protein [Glarea lozoyensis ATCC 20868]EPE35294.1 Ankyrin repeat-containing protein [Glarea lozoyensis ATCC 20868]
MGQFKNLPTEVIQAVIDNVLSAMEFEEALLLRATCKIFDQTILYRLYRNGPPFVPPSVEVNQLKCVKPPKDKWIRTRPFISARLMAGFLFSQFEKNKDTENSIMNVIKRAVDHLEDGGVSLNPEARRIRIYALCEALARSCQAEKCISLATVRRVPCMDHEYALLEYAQLIVAVVTNDYSFVEDWLDDQSLATISNIEGIFGSPLTAAIAAGQLGMAKLLLNHGANVNHQAETSLTPLHMACSSGNLAAVKLLFSASYNLRISGTSYEHGVRMAIKFHYWAIAQYLLANSDIPYSNRSTLRYSIFHEAAIVGDCSVLLEMLDTGVNPNTNCHSYKEPFGNQTALGCAAIMGHEDAVRLLIDRNWDVDHYGFGNALVGAAQHGQLAVVEILLDAGVDINYVALGNQWNAYSATPLSASLRALRFDTTYYLLGRGADVNAGGKGASSLLLACKRGNVPIVRMLIERGVDPNGYASERSKRSVPLLTALKRGHTRVAEVLIELGARDINPYIYEND